MKVAQLSGLGIACFCLAYSQPVQAEMLTLGTASGGQLFPFFRAASDFAFEVA